MQIIKVDKCGVITIALNKEEMEDLRGIWETPEMVFVAKSPVAPEHHYETAEKG